MATDRYVLYLPLRLSILWIVLTHPGRRECSPIEQRTVLGNKKPDPSHFFQRCVLRPQASPPPLPLLAPELNLTLPFRYRLGRALESGIPSSIVHLCVSATSMFPIPILCPPHRTALGLGHTFSPKYWGPDFMFKLRGRVGRHHSSHTVLEVNIGRSSMTTRGDRRLEIQ